MVDWQYSTQQRLGPRIWTEFWIVSIPKKSTSWAKFYTFFPLLSSPFLSFPLSLELLSMHTKALGTLFNTPRCEVNTVTPVHK